MGNLTGFNAEEVAPAEAREGFEVIPNGIYAAIITDSEMKTTKNGAGQYLELVHQLIDEGKHYGRRLWARLNIANPSQKAQQIGQAELSAVCRAVKVMQPQDSAQLHNIVIYILVRVVRNKQSGDMENQISGWMTVEEGKAKLAAQGTPPPAATRPGAPPPRTVTPTIVGSPPPQTPQAPTNSPPWRR